MTNREIFDKLDYSDLIFAVVLDTGEVIRVVNSDSKYLLWNPEKEEYTKYFSKSDIYYDYYYAVIEELTILSPVSVKFIRYNKETSELETNSGRVSGKFFVSDINDEQIEILDILESCEFDDIFFTLD